jgi:hypothetical protein
MKKLFILFALFAHVVAAQNVPNYVPTNGLVGWWPFNGNANDLSGNGNNGVVNGATLTTDRFGYANKAYDFNSNNNTYIQAGIGIQDTLTFSAWFKCGVPTSYYGMIYSYGDASVTGSTYSGQIMGPHPIWVSASLVGKFHPYAFNNGYLSEIIPNQYSDDNNWHNVIVTYIPNDKIYFYYDGVFIINSALNAFSITQGIVTFGRDLNNNVGLTTNQGKFNGKIDDIGIWNRALTPAEIQTLYFGCTDTLAQNPTSATATVGANATFTALSSASGATYQWQAKNGSNFVNVSNAGQFSGATSSTLTVNSVSSANNGLQVRCIVDHGDCVDTSDIAVLTSCFSLTAQPLDQFVVAGSSANFTAATNDPACTYQWQTNAGFGFQNLSNAGQFSGVTSAALSVSGVSQANNNQVFRCIVSAGTCLDTTASAKIVLSGVGVPENVLMRVSVSPNPTRGSVDLGVALEGTYTLIGIDGRAVQTGSIRQVLDFSNQPAGVYSLRLETPAGNRIVKVVKE